MSNKPKEFVLVHGAGHGAWCWYKLIPLLRKAGHRVTALDMAASGINPERIEDVWSLGKYSEPLIRFLSSLPGDQKVIIVGHSLGGLNVSVAMEMFPEKIEIAVFLTAFMPDHRHTPSYTFDKYVEVVSEDHWLDTEFKCRGDPKEFFTTVFLGRKFLAKAYHSSLSQDLELAMTLVRPSTLFAHELWKPESKLSKERYGSVRRVYIVCEDDQLIPQVHQRWMVENCGVEEVEELKGADHMPMFSMPHNLCDCLLNIATNKLEALTEN